MSNMLTKICSTNNKKDHYEAKACVVWCFDDRFTPALEVLQNSLNLDDYDLISIAGGSKSLASPSVESDKDFVLRQIDTSVRLHHTEQVILMNHSDCGAYGGLQKFDDDTEKEKEFLVEDLKKAKAFLEKNLVTKVPVRMIYVDFENIWDVVD